MVCPLFHSAEVDHHCSEKWGRAWHFDMDHSPNRGLGYTAVDVLTVVTSRAIFSDGHDIQLIDKHLNLADTAGGDHTLHFQRPQNHSATCSEQSLPCILSP